MLAALEPLAISARDVTEDEMAKTHARYLAGGRSSAPVEGERIIRFEFPEHSGALRSFLSNLKEDGVGLTMLHYRSHGGQVGKVLAGVSVPLGRRRASRPCWRGWGTPRDLAFLPYVISARLTYGGRALSLIGTPSTTRRRTRSTPST